MIRGKYFMRQYDTFTCCIGHGTEYIFGRICAVIYAGCSIQQSTGFFFLISGTGQSYTFFAVWWCSVFDVTKCSYLPQIKAYIVNSFLKLLIRLVDFCVKSCVFCACVYAHLKNEQALGHPTNLGSEKEKWAGRTTLKNYSMFFSTI